MPVIALLRYWTNSVRYLYRKEVICSLHRFWGPFSVCPLTTGVSFPGGKVGRNVKLIVPFRPLLGFGIHHVRPCALRAKRLLLLRIETTRGWQCSCIGTEDGRIERWGKALSRYCSGHVCRKQFFFPRVQIAAHVNACSVASRCGCLYSTDFLRLRMLCTVCSCRHNMQ